ncbi:MAG TPA: NADH-quinone oxidoreductase subunit A [Dysgonamonadaceae bacterium]|nr:NADH-quinone oxidoreductase subunit A [Dysgonamonadaceae bacterium]
MDTKTILSISFEPFVLYTTIAMVIIVSMLVISWFLGEKRSGTEREQPYESGIKPTDSARLRFPSKFYLIAMFFVLFDIEAVFLFLWAVAFRETGWIGFIAAAVFIGILLALLIYEISIGALDFETSGKKILRTLNKKKNSKHE